MGEGQEGGEESRRVELPHVILGEQSRRKTGHSGTITDILGLARTIEVQASLFDPVAQGSLAIRGGGLAVPNGFQAGKVVVLERHKEYR